jgi:hypothetical protein
MKQFFNSPFLFFSIRKTGIGADINTMNPITQAIRIQTERTNEMEHSTPLFLSSSFCFEKEEDIVIDN